MYADYQDCKYQTLVKEIVNVFYKVYNRLGHGFLEKVYKEAMLIELKKEGIPSLSQSGMRVFYEGRMIEECNVNILVDNKIIVKVKAGESLGKENEAQLLDYLKASNIEVGLLVNFGTKLEVKHKIFNILCE